MLIKHIFLGFAGIAAGVGVSAGTFAFLIVVGVLPRMIGKCNRAAETMHFENAIILGGTLGNIVSVFPEIPVPLGRLMLYLYGLSAGIFMGCMAVALAEILNTFPIMFRRFGLKEGLSWVMLSMALGKTVGSLYYFIQGIASS
ncbi:MAG: stage V sporulation protein AB [Roseburia sp.]|nr:stage V sporulation protein AB [Roseburia sp.]